MLCTYSYKIHNLLVGRCVEFPLPFGRVMSATESFIRGLDEKTSASLKFTVLNPKGRIWTMVAGGGASVIYADTLGDLGYASELGNYAEYSRAPMILPGINCWT
nr:ATP-citrate synthase alpha chain protein 1 [Ipomoea batatas]